MAHDDRKRIWVERFQTQLTLRIGGYLLLFLVVLLNFLFAWRLWREGPGNLLDQFVGMLGDYLPVLICLVVLVPVMAWDALRFTHRMVGPLVRFRRAMTAIAEGEAVTPIKLREKDYLTELRDDFNTMLESLQKRGVPVLKPLEPKGNEPHRRETA